MQGIAARVRLLIAEQTPPGVDHDNEREGADFDNFWGKFRAILELLVAEYNSRRCRMRRGYPYPLVRDFCERDRQTGRLTEPNGLWHRTN
jgi:hypothetical protein